jgi:DNA-binding FadR family transcriptional regulator
MERISRAEALAARLEEKISAEALEPGERLGTKDELRERYGVAAGTLNEAMRIMAVRGVVDARPGPGGGVFVARRPVLFDMDWTRATLGDCVELRAVLEPAVCTAAARAATRGDLADLSELVDEMEGALTDGPHAYLRANWRFHDRVARLGPNVPMRAVYLTLIDVLGRGLDDFAFDDDAAAIAVHRDLVAAIASGDDGQIARAVAAHMQRSPLGPTSRSGRPGSARTR